jgi:hypothetical protein
MKDVTVENGQVQKMEKQFFRPFECTMPDGVTICHSVPLIHIAHVTVIIHHNLRLYGFPSVNAEITFGWGVVNIRQHAYVSFVPPQYCRQVSPGPYMNVSLLQFHCLGC